MKSDSTEHRSFPQHGWFPGIRFETPETGAGGVVEAPVEVGAVEVGADPSPEAAAGAEAAAAEGVPSPEGGGPDLDLDDPRVRAALAEIANEQLEQVLAQAAAAHEAEQGQPQTPPVPDPLADDYPEQLQRWDEYQRQQTLAQIAPFVQTVQEYQRQQTQATIGEILTGITDIDGFDASSKEAQDLAKHFAREEAGRLQAQGYRDERKAAEAALRYGAQKVAEFAKAQRAAGEQAYLERMRKATAAPTELAAVGEGTEVGADADTEAEAALRFLARARAS